jgi:hypothetical protein
VDRFGYLANNINALVSSNGATFWKSAVHSLSSESRAMATPE